MEPARAARALLLGADESLASLLSDVLGELGICLQAGEAGPSRPDLVLILMHRGENILHVLQRARDGTYPAPIFVLVPFADEPLMQRALRLGARGCFALGQPLDGLRHMLLTAIRGPARPPSPSRVTTGLRPTEEHDD